MKYHEQIQMERLQDRQEQQMMFGRNLSGSDLTQLRKLELKHLKNLHAQRQGRYEL